MHCPDPKTSIRWMNRLLLLLQPFVLVLAASPASGQSDPTGFDQVYNVSTSTSRSSLSGNAQLNLFDDGHLSYDFTASQKYGDEEADYEVNIFGGIVEKRFNAKEGGVVNVLGGTMRDYFHVSTEMNVRGGTFGRGFFAGEGTTLYGGEFSLNGTPLSNGAVVSLEASDILSGVFEDGSVFIFSYDANDHLEDVMLAEAALPPLTTPIVVDSGSGPNGLRPGQTLTLHDGGTLGENFAAVDAILNVSGGSVGDRAEFLNSQVEISGGEVGNGLLAYSGTVIDITGGKVGFFAEAYSGSVLRQTGGSMGRLKLHPGSELVLSGGEIYSVYANAGAVFHMSGGTIEEELNVSTEAQTVISGGFVDLLVAGGYNSTPHNEVNVVGGEIKRFELEHYGAVSIKGGTLGRYHLSRAGQVNLFGGEFLYNGKPVVDGALPTLGYGDRLIGTLEDGSVFFITPQYLDCISGVTLHSTTLPKADTEPILITSESDLRGLRAGQTLTLADGGTLGDEFLSVGAVLNIDGGDVGRQLLVSGGELNLRDGTIGPLLKVYDGATVNISGGVLSEGDLGGRAEVHAGSTINITGGEIDTEFVAQPGTIVNISGGMIGTGGYFRASESQVNITDGTFESSFSALDSDVTVSGGDFSRNTSLTGTVSISGGTFNYLHAVGSVSLTDGQFESATIGAKDGEAIVSGGTFKGNVMLGGNGVRVEGGILGDATAGKNSVVNLSGGRLSSLTAQSGSQVSIEGAWIANASIEDGGEVAFSRGYVRKIEVLEGGVLDLSGEGAADGVKVQRGGVANISSGVIRVFSVQPHGEANITGGIFGPGFTASNSTSVRLFGGEFLLNGVPISGEDPLSLGDTDILTGTLEDGSVFIFSPLVQQYGGGDRLTEVLLNRTSVPALETAPMTVRDANAPRGLRTGQTLTVVEGGVLPNYFASVDATLTVAGGVVGDTLEVHGGVVNLSSGEIGPEMRIYDGTVFNMSGGTLGKYSDVLPGAVLNISGGSVDKYLEIHDGAVVNMTGGNVVELRGISGSELNVSGGVIEKSISLREGTTVNISGGEVPTLYTCSGSVTNISGGVLPNGLVAQPGSETNISGGRVAKLTAAENSDVRISGGSIVQGFSAQQGSSVRIAGGRFGAGIGTDAESDVSFFGGEYVLNGQALIEDATLSLSDSDVLTGTLEDGSVFILAPERAGQVERIRLIQGALPPLEPSPIVVDGGPGPNGLRAGQRLELLGGGSLPENFAAVDATLLVDGGTVGDGFKALRTVLNVASGSVGDGGKLYAGSEIHLSGGEVGDSFNVCDGGRIVISGGVIGEYFHTGKGSTVDISGGSIGDTFVAEYQSEVNISGGSSGNSFTAETDTVVNISGGTFGDEFTVYPEAHVTISGGTFGNGFLAYAGNDLQFLGGEFRMNGVSVEEEASISLTDTDVFTGTLEDGSVFIFSPLARFVEYQDFDVLDPRWSNDFFLPPKIVQDALDGMKVVQRPLPSAVTTPILVNSDNAPAGLRPGQTLSLLESGVLPDNFAVVEATLNVEGGAAGSFLEAFGAQVNVTSGSIGDQFQAYTGTIVNISGGSIGADFTAHAGSVVYYSGGEIDSGFTAKSGSEVIISGGTLKNTFKVERDCVVNITGGAIEGYFSLQPETEITISGGSIGDSFYLAPGSTLNLIGSSFDLNGSPINGLVPGVPFEITDFEQELRGTLLDGSDFSADLSRLFPYNSLVIPPATITVMIVPEASSLFLLVAALTCLLGWRCSVARVFLHESRHT